MIKRMRGPKHRIQTFLSQLRHSGVRNQIIFTCGSLMAIMILSGAMLGTISYETMQDYHASTQMVADVYTLNDTLESWNTSLEDYVLNTTELSRHECTAFWTELGELLQSFYVGEDESAHLLLANLQAVYDCAQKEMDQLMLADDNSIRVTSYIKLSEQKSGLLFLSDQLLRLFIENDVQNYPKTISNNLFALCVFFLILLFSFVLLLVCSKRIIRLICTPIDLLVHNAEQIANGHYDTPDVAIINDDEMGYLSQAFNNMKAQVSANFKNMERIIELQDLLQSTELKALQSQINPHFLFNVLSVAEEAALYENAGQTVEIIENISYMLQYSLKCTKQDTTFQEELRMVTAYLFLQEKRFGDRIHFVLSTPKTLPHLLIPGMSLQPVVENAIRHGVEKMEHGAVVQVQVRERSQCMEVCISDNGCGIEPNLLAAIQRGDAGTIQNGPGGIGLINVSRRMEIFYKQRGLFHISSIQARGTTVVLRYPLTESKVEYV